MQSGGRPASGADDGSGGTNAGWLAGFVVVAVVCVAGAALWFSYHPI